METYWPWSIHQGLLRCQSAWPEGPLSMSGCHYHWAAPFSPPPTSYWCHCCHLENRTKCVYSSGPPSQLKYYILQHIYIYQHIIHYPSKHQTEHRPSPARSPVTWNRNFQITCRCQCPWYCDISLTGPLLCWWTFWDLTSHILILVTQNTNILQPERQDTIWLLFLEMRFKHCSVPCT